MAKKSVKKPFVPGCEECTLNVRKRIDPFMRVLDTAGERVLLVGESPSISDIGSGELFAGQQGDLIAAMLERFGIDGLSYAYTNVAMCYAGKGKKPKIGDVAHCDMYLRAFIETFQPTKILCMGKLAAKALLGKELGNEKLYKLREQMPFEVEVPPVDDDHSWSYANVYITYSPNMVLKETKYIDDFVADWEFMCDPPDHTWVDAKPETVYLDGSVPKIKKGIKKFTHDHYCDGGVIALDFETTGLHPIINRPVTLALSWQPESALVINLHDLTDKQMKALLTYIYKELLFENFLVYHEGKFDIKFYKQWGGVTPTLDWDTKMVDYIRTGNPEASRGLKYLARRKFFAPAYSKDIVFDGTTDIKDMAIYNGRDSSSTLQLMRLYEGTLDEREEKLATYLNEVSSMLVAVELKGAPVDEKWLNKRKKVLDERKATLKETFDKLELNPNSPKQVMIRFGTKKSDKKALKAIIEREAKDSGSIDGKLAKDILDYRLLTKELSTYVDGFIKHIYEGRVHTDYRVFGTKTGRLSSRGPNMQNLKSDDDPDHNYQAVVSSNDKRTDCTHFDYSQIEMRRMAIESGDEHLLDLFASGRDIHAELAEEIFKDKFDPDSTNQRVKAKRTNFGIIYGISCYGLAEQLDIDEGEAQDYLDTWFKMYPGVVKWWEGIKAHVTNDRIVYTEFGRARKFYLDSLVLDEEAMGRQGINFPIQSASCDVHLYAALKIYKKTGLFPVQLVHDELVYELDKKDIDDTIDYITWSLRKTAEDLTGNVLPFPADIKGD